MGANAQTTVPTFTAAQVLTADQMNQSARTGVPVFADTAARDAAFGGAGEKTLAEGQLAYLEDSNIVQYYDGSVWATVGPTASGGVVQVVNSTYSALATGTTLIPRDDTIPQNTEGDQYMSQAITPTSATNVLVVQVVFFGGSSAIGDFAGALFIDSTANAVAACLTYVEANENIMLVLTYTQVAGGTSAIDFKFRAGNSAAGTTSFNGRAGVRLYGAITKSSMTITEYTP